MNKYFIYDGSVSIPLGTTHLKFSNFFNKIIDISHVTTITHVIFGYSYPLGAYRYQRENTDNNMKDK